MFTFYILHINYHKHLFNIILIESLRNKEVIMCSKS